MSNVQALLKMIETLDCELRDVIRYPPPDRPSRELETRSRSERETEATEVHEVALRCPANCRHDSNFEVSVLGGTPE